ncbi:MAG: 50S ribosomal protein L20 [Candidatus Pacebacteria bacterium]|nr:50S ribosomal protein L20 [Candidatus Paceibacterota bacterium]MBP9840187.1 50S ribosomal protein L20 [Candidatus Paceibacterota bacterium]
MARVKGGVTSNKRRRNVLKRAKGYRHARSKKERFAKEALVHAGKYAFNHRKDKKTDMRQLWIVRLNAAVRENGFKSYSSFIDKLKKGGISLDRKVLSTLAMEHPEVFARVIKKVA